MLYAVLCYAQEDAVTAWSKEQDEAVMGKLAAVQQRYAAAGKLGPVARLLPTTAATTARKVRGESFILDGPFAETKEQLLGFFVIEAADMDAALAIAAEEPFARTGTVVVREGYFAKLERPGP